MDVTPVVLGILGTACFAAWALDLRGWTTRLLRALYQFGGSWFWPGGDEESYVAFNRYIGWFGVVIMTGMLVSGTLSLMHPR